MTAHRWTVRDSSPLFLLAPFGEESAGTEVLSLPNAATLYDSSSTIKLFLSLLRNCDFAAGMNCNVNIRYADYLLCDPVILLFDLPKGPRPTG